MLLSLLRCLNDCSGQQLPSQSQGKLVFQQQTLWEASGLPHHCFRFCYFFLFSCRKLLKRRSPAPHSAFQNHFKCTLLGWDSCFYLLRGKKKKREKEFFCSFFSLLYRLSFKRHVCFHFWPRFHSISATTSSLQASLCSLSLAHGKAAELKRYLSFPLQQPGTNPRAASQRRDYRDTFISGSQSPVHHAPGPVVADSLETSLGSHSACILIHTSQATPRLHMLLQRNSQG